MEKLVKMRLLQFFCSLILLTGCASTGSNLKEVSGGDAARASTARNPAKGSHAQRTYINSEKKITDYSYVLVEDAQVDTTEERNPKVDDFLTSMQGTINGALLLSLDAAGVFEEVLTKSSEVAGKKYLVCRSDALVHFGSTAARFLIGWGAGRSKLIVVHSLVDPVSGEILVKYTGWGGAVGGLGFEILDKMRSDATSIARYFGQIIAAR